ncbi:hypothetical protein BDQ17DRAFT_1377777 [Cyathus striatus]|nr:hypothetical protein BDQ17DRAFT_1377777 [Cyathus striatus]
MASHPSLLPAAAHRHRSRQHPHKQLRDLIICPRERGVVNYVQPHAIVEHDLLHPTALPRTIADLEFTPNCLTSLPVNDGNDTLLAAGGQEAEIHLSLHTPSSASSSSGTSTSFVWKYYHKLQGSINNSVFLTGLSLTRAHESAAEPRVGISNNDFTVKVYVVPMRVTNQERALREVGCVRLDVPVNHSSISPDGQTLLSVGDSSKLYLHHISGSSSKLTFSHLHSIPLPPPLPPTTANLAASFSTSFSGNGLKFAVGSQEGVVAVYDVRRPDDKSRGGGSLYSGGGGLWLNDDPSEWARGSSKAPGWSARSVKFSKVGGGREVLVFTEHTSYIHILDASTFQTDELISVPAPLPSNRYLHLPSPASSCASTSSSPPIRRGILRRSRQQQQAQQSIVQALSESFPIPTPSSTSTISERRFSPPESISDSTWRTLQMAMVRGQQRGEDEDEEEGVVVIPHLGDRALESDVHALLEGHGIVARRASSPSSDEEEDENTGSDRGDYRHAMKGDDMDVNEEGEERECTPSTSTSPSLGAAAAARMGSFASAPSPEPISPILGEREREREMQRERERERESVRSTYPDDLDIAGVCTSMCVSRSTPLHRLLVDSCH